VRLCIQFVVATTTEKEYSVTSMEPEMSSTVATVEDQLSSTSDSGGISKTIYSNTTEDGKIVKCALRISVSECYFANSCCVYIFQHSFLLQWIMWKMRCPLPQKHMMKKRMRRVSVCVFEIIHFNNACFLFTSNLNWSCCGRGGIINHLIHNHHLQFHHNLE